MLVSVDDALGNTKTLTCVVTVAMSVFLEEEGEQRLGRLLLLCVVVFGVFYRNAYVQFVAYAAFVVEECLFVSCSS